MHQGEIGTSHGKEGRWQVTKRTTLLDWIVRFLEAGGSSQKGLIELPKR
jgi:hypothetical protein